MGAGGGGEEGAGGEEVGAGGGWRSEAELRFGLVQKGVVG